MKKEFRRNLLVPTLFLITSLAYGFNTFFYFSMGEMASGYIWIAGCLIFLFISIWSYRTPYIIIENDTMFIKGGNRKNKKGYPLSDIETISFLRKNRIEILVKDRPLISIRLNLMTKTSREDFEKLMMEYKSVPPNGN